mmetsp:Transcript_3652/g.5793  ORF Transcript_3652/g.5793 Transcript_3652/m.5793 type:complete len:136 (-) Transcript_3652:184-591(-)
MRTHTGFRPFQCQECKKEFSQRGNMLTHMRIHTGELKYACTYEGCFERFRYIKVRDFHISRDHASAARDFSCKICQKVFDTKEGVQVHEDIHSTSLNPPFACPICGPTRVFETKRAFFSHFTRVHCASTQNIELL